jgi:hypothetical protein
MTAPVVFGDLKRQVRYAHRSSRIGREFPIERGTYSKRKRFPPLGRVRAAFKAQVGRN